MTVAQSGCSAGAVDRGCFENQCDDRLHEADDLRVPNRRDKNIETSRSLVIDCPSSRHVAPISSVRTCLDYIEKRQSNEGFINTVDRI